MELMAKFAHESNITTNKGKKRKRPTATATQSKSKHRTQLVVDDDNEEIRDEYEDDSTQEVNSDYNSESEGYSDSDENLIGNIITESNEQLQDSLGSSEVDKQTINSAVKADDIFCQDYIVEPQTRHSDPVLDTLATTLSNWCRIPPKKDNLKELFKSAMTPENVEGLMPVRINDGLYRKLPFRARVNDQRLRGLNMFIAKGCGPLATVFHDLCNMDAEIKASGLKEGEQTGKLTPLKVGDKCFDITNLRKALGISLQLLASAHSHLLVRRKVNLRLFLDKRFHYLTRDSNPVTSLLLGGDLEQKISDLLKVSDIAQKLTSPRYPRHRGFRGHRPFFNRNFGRSYDRSQDRHRRRQNWQRGHGQHQPSYRGQRNFRSNAQRGCGGRSRFNSR